MKREKIIREVAKIVRTYLSTDYKILLFGSWAKGNPSAGSDLDIAILGKKKVPWPKMAKILCDLEEIPTLRSIDLVDLQSVSKSFKNDVLKTAHEVRT